jgi:hypothetical protein
LVDNADLKRMVQMHDAFSRAFHTHLSRLWGREPSRRETDTLQSFTLCTSLMALESVERGLAQATVVETADEYFAVMESQVQKHSDGAIGQVRRRLSLDESAPDPAKFANLLVWEQALVEWASALS